MNLNTSRAELFQAGRKIYSSLIDDESREYFRLRTLFNLTSDFNYIKELISLVPDFKGEKTHPNIDFFIKCKNYELDKRKLIIYGAGVWGKQLVKLSLGGIQWYAYCDKDKVKQGNTFFGLPVISPEKLIQEYEDAIVIIPGFKHMRSIYEDLMDLGFNSSQILYFDQDPYGETVFLEDKQYFENNIVQPQENEVFVDGGCFDFHSSKTFTKWCEGKYEKIFAFEPDPSNFKVCEENIKNLNLNNVNLINAGLWKENGELHFNAEGHGGSSISEAGSSSVNVVSLDDVLGDQRVTFIKMDIEGAELEALKGAEKSIIANRPKLAICIYHKPEDILEIPMYLLSLVPDYKFYIRHYSNYTIETVLYAV